MYKYTLLKNVELWTCSEIL